jgi:hypothetical protein
VDVSDDGALLHLDQTFELEGSAKPACFAASLAYIASGSAAPATADTLSTEDR